MKAFCTAALKIKLGSSNFIEDDFNPYGAVTLHECLFKIQFY